MPMPASSPCGLIRSGYLGKDLFEIGEIEYGAVFDVPMASDVSQRICLTNNSQSYIGAHFCGLACGF